MSYLYTSEMIYLGSYTSNLRRASEFFSLLKISHFVIVGNGWFILNASRRDLRNLLSERFVTIDIKLFHDGNYRL